MRTYVNRMSPNMLKIHVIGNDGEEVMLHVFTGGVDDEYHDHPWPFESTIHDGGYTEEVINPDKSLSHIERRPGDTFQIEAAHIHRLVHLPTGMCVTEVKPGPPAQQWAHYRLHFGNLERRYPGQPHFEIIK